MLSDRYPESKSELLKWKKRQVVEAASFRQPSKTLIISFKKGIVLEGRRTECGSAKRRHGSSFMKTHNTQAWPTIKGKNTRLVSIGNVDKNPEASIAPCSDVNLKVVLALSQTPGWTKCVFPSWVHSRDKEMAIKACERCPPRKRASWVSARVADGAALAPNKCKSLEFGNFLHHNSAITCETSSAARNELCCMPEKMGPASYISQPGPLPSRRGQSYRTKKVHPWNRQ